MLISNVYLQYLHLSFIENKILKYRLLDNFILRQFKNASDPVLINLDNGERIKLDKSFLTFISLCDGKTDLDVFSFLPNFDTLVKFALDNGWIKESEESLKPIQHFKKINTPDLPLCQWSITGSCNAHCKHCFISASQHKHKDLNTKDMINILDKLAEHCVYKVLITGGEPLFRNDFSTIVREMSKRNIKVSVVSTNGFLLSDKILDLFEECNMHPSFIFSFDGLGHHDWLRGVKGAQDMTIRAMDLCKKRGYKFLLTMCIHKGNYKSIHDTVKFAAEKGADEIVISPVSVYGGYSGGNDIDIINIEEAYNIYLDYLKTYCKERPQVDLTFQGFVSVKHNNIKDYKIVPLKRNFTDLENDRPCQSLSHSFYISDEGRVLPCIALAGTGFENDCLKLTENSFEQCLDSFVYKQLTSLTVNDIVQKNQKCIDCEYLKYCGCGCRAASCFFDDDFYSTDQALCNFFHMKMHEKIKQIMDTA